MELIKSPSNNYHRNVINLRKKDHYTTFQIMLLNVSIMNFKNLQHAKIDQRHKFIKSHLIKTKILSFFCFFQVTHTATF